MYAQPMVHYEGGAAGPNKAWPPRAASLGEPPQYYGNAGVSALGPRQPGPSMFMSIPMGSMQAGPHSGMPSYATPSPMMHMQGPHGYQQYDARLLRPARGHEDDDRGGGNDDDDNDVDDDEADEDDDDDDDSGHAGRGSGSRRKPTKSRSMTTTTSAKGRRGPSRTSGGGSSSSSSSSGGGAADEFGLGDLSVLDSRLGHQQLRSIVVMAEQAAAARLQSLDGADDDDDDDDDGGGAGRRPGTPGSGAAGAGRRRGGGSGASLGNGNGVVPDRASRRRELNRVNAKKSRLRKKYFIEALVLRIATLEADSAAAAAAAAAAGGRGPTSSVLSSSGESAMTSSTSSSSMGESLSGGSSGATSDSGSDSLASTIVASSSVMQGGLPGSSLSSSAASDHHQQHRWGHVDAGESTSVAIVPRVAVAGPGASPVFRDALISHGPDWNLVRALESAGQSFCIGDPTAPDTPLAHVSPAFEVLTGYSASEVVGRNCRFLQGPGTDRDAAAKLGHAIREGRDAATVLLNYRKDGTPFWNHVVVTPIRDESGVVRSFLGIQTCVNPTRPALQAWMAGAHRGARAVHGPSQDNWGSSIDSSATSSRTYTAQPPSDSSGSSLSSASSSTPATPMPMPTLPLQRAQPSQQHSYAPTTTAASSAGHAVARFEGWMVRPPATTAPTGVHHSYQQQQQHHHPMPTAAPTALSPATIQGVMRSAAGAATPRGSLPMGVTPASVSAGASVVSPRVNTAAAGSSGVPSTSSLSSSSSSSRSAHSSGSGAMSDQDAAILISGMRAGLMPSDDNAEEGADGTAARAAKRGRPGDSSSAV